jgi:hypothetical protein
VFFIIIGDGLVIRYTAYKETALEQAYKKHIMMVILSALLTFMLAITACSSGPSPAVAVENYLQALAAKDEVAAVNFSCSDWEEQAHAEGSSFINVEVSLEDLNCQVASEKSDAAVVTCSGRFLFSYDAGENQELDLGGRKFSTIKENGLWLMCGYQK